MGDFGYPEIKQQRARITFLVVLMFLLCAIFVARLAQLQIVRHAHYTALAQASQARKFEVPAIRGEVMALDGDQPVPLAMNQRLFLLYADPSLIPESRRSQIAEKIANIINESPEAILAKLNAPGSYAVLKDRLGSQAADQIKAERLIGIGLSERQYRTYPEGSLASQILGFVNNEGEGQYGVESYFNRELAGEPGLLRAITDIQGNPIATAKNVARPPIHGKDLVLTIDRNIQSQVEKYLAEGVKRVGAKSGGVIVMEPHSGRIMAMANYPSFDPAKFSEVRNYNLFGNSAVSAVFEPGSGFKSVTMAAGIDTGKVTADTTYRDPGSEKIDGHTIRNAGSKSYGRQTMSQVIQNSLNTGIIFVLRRLGTDPDKITPAGKKTLYEYVQKFGFGTPTGIQMPNEAAGVVPPPGSRDINYANMVFGQGVSVTMVQMTSAFAAIVNGGILYQPQIIDRIIDSSGGEGRTVSKQAVNRQVISSASSRILREMMVDVVEDGSGYAARIPGYRVAGKTGTAQVPRTDGRGYDPNKNIGTFIGYAPADDPRFVMMVKIDEPKVGGYAEITAVPVFGDIARYLVNYLRIPSR